ncbi:unnamed protein product [Kluyveromyces dobzhanskii CBS 2104]|uniref:WGS project CCBQ000000000 data, contig 00010 n=1 Tax=Kluyveromyces dobzhanskii CBS 2104 TaxID=1427455 RepID=A0A0A8LAB4_9SACH|nr:unnamed protein product [Kluyveromyces dobzhanskii CBS 2104]
MMRKTVPNNIHKNYAGFDLREYSKLTRSNEVCEIQVNKVTMVKKPRGRPKKHVETKLCGPNLMPVFNGAGDFRVAIQEEVSIKIRYCFNTKPTNWMYFWFISHVLPEFSYQMWYSIVQLKHRQDLVDLMIGRFEFLKLIAMQQFSKGSKDIDKSWESRRISHSHDQLACLFVELFNSISIDNWNTEILRLQNKLESRLKGKPSDNRSSNHTLSIHEKVFLLAKTYNLKITPVIEWMLCTLEDIYTINQNTATESTTRGTTVSNIPIMTKSCKGNGKSINLTCTNQPSLAHSDEKFLQPMLSIDTSDFISRPLGENECLLSCIDSLIQDVNDRGDESGKDSQTSVLFELILPSSSRQKVSYVLDLKKREFLKDLTRLNPKELRNYLTHGEIWDQKQTDPNVKAEIGYRNCVLSHCFGYRSSKNEKEHVVSNTKDNSNLDKLMSTQTFSSMRSELCIETTSFTPARKLWYDRWVSELAKSKVHFVEGFPRSATEPEQKYWIRLEELLFHYFAHFGVQFIGFSINDFETVKLPPPCLQTRYIIFKRDGSLKLNKNPRLWDYGKAIRFLQDMGLDVSPLQNMFSLLQDGTLRKRKAKESQRRQRSQSQKRAKRSTPAMVQQPDNHEVPQELQDPLTLDWSESLEFAKPPAASQSSTPFGKSPRSRKYLKEDSVELKGSIENDATLSSLSDELDSTSLKMPRIDSRKEKDSVENCDRSVMEGNTTVFGCQSSKEPSPCLPQFIGESSQLHNTLPRSTEEPEFFSTAPEAEIVCEAESENSDILHGITKHTTITCDAVKLKLPKRYHSVINSMLQSITQFTSSALIEENHQWSNLISERDQLIHTLSGRLIEKEKLIATYQGKLLQIHSESATDKLLQ